MKHLRYEVKGEKYINRFITTGVFAEPRSFKKAVLSGRVNEWLKKGFSIHENPCRKEMIAVRRDELPPYRDISMSALGQEVEIFGQRRVLSAYFPFGNIGYEESRFYYCPTYLRTYCYVALEAEQDEIAAFGLETCGGGTIWNNDELVTDYIPFTRNMVKHTEINIPLRKGTNKLIVCLDDLAERDTDYYFHLCYQGEQKLVMVLPVPDEVDTEKVKRYEDILDLIYFNKEAYISEDVTMTLPAGLIHDDFLKLIISHGEFVEKMNHQTGEDRISQYELTAGQKHLILMEAEDILPGYYNFVFEMEEGPVKIRRKVGNQIVWKKFLGKGSDDSKVRKTEFLNTLISYGSDNVYKAAAYFGRGYGYEEAERIIFEEIGGVKDRQDCSDFHFIAVLYIYDQFYDKLSQELRQIIEETALGYRYWIDEPGDDVMWFFSENHALLFHTCQYLAGKLFPDKMFTNSGRYGEEVSRHGRMLLDEWFEEFFCEFITEWNSNAYIPVDVHGLAAIYNITKEEDPLHEKAKHALDMVCYSMAVNEHKGAVMTSFGRTYEKEMKGNYNAGTTSLLYLLYNAGHLTRAGIGSIFLALSDYEAPEEYGKYIGLKDGEVLIHQNTQGFEQHVNLYLYKNSKVLLSTAVAFKPFQKGYQEHIMQATIDKTAQIFINHPGESHPYGSGRPNYWAGNGILPLGVQYRNTGILVYDIPEENRIDDTHAYIPLCEYQQYMGSEDSLVAAKEGGYIGVRAQNGIILQRSGVTAYREFISPGRKNIWIVKVASAGDYDSLEDFLEEMKAISIGLNANGEILIQNGDMNYEIGIDNRFLVNGEIVHHYPMDVKGNVVMERENSHV